MRKKLLFLGYFLAIVCSVNAEILDPSIGDTGTNQNGKGPRTILPVVELTSEGNDLVFDITHYLGDVELTILSEGTTYSGYINGNGVFTVDVTGIDLGYHEFILTLSNGMSYSGHFTMN